MNVQFCAMLRCVDAVGGKTAEESKAILLTHAASPALRPTMARAILMLTDEALARAVLDNPVLSLLGLEDPRVVQAAEDARRRMASGQGGRIFPNVPAWDGVPRMPIDLSHLPK